MYVFSRKTTHPNRFVWDQVNAKVTKCVGWILFIAGWTVVVAYGAYAFATDPGESNWEVWATAALSVGIIVLLASVIWERYKESRDDPYKDVQR